MHNKQRGVNTSEQNCKIGKVTKVNVETEATENNEDFMKPLKDLFRSFGETFNPITNE